MSSGLDPATWGTLPTLFMGATFTLGLILVVIAGSHLLTGNMMLVPISAMQDRITTGDVVRNLTLVLIGNVLGAMFVAYFLAVETGVVGLAAYLAMVVLLALVAAVSSGCGLLPWADENTGLVCQRGVGPGVENLDNVDPLAAGQPHQPGHRRRTERHGSPAPSSGPRRHPG